MNQRPDLMPAGQKPLDQMGTSKTGCAGDEYTHKDTPDQLNSPSTPIIARRGRNPTPYDLGPFAIHPVHAIITSWREGTTLIGTTAFRLGRLAPQ